MARAPRVARTSGGNITRSRTLKGGKSSVKVSLAGGDDMLRALQRLDRATSDEHLVEAVAPAAEILADAWRLRVPVDEGHYRDAIRADASPGKEGATGIVYIDEVGGLPPDQQPRLYASRLEWGTKAITKKLLKKGIAPDEGRIRAAHPSLRPAFDGVVGRMTDSVGEELRYIINAATRTR